LSDATTLFDTVLGVLRGSDGDHVAIDYGAPGKGGWQDDKPRPFGLLATWDESVDGSIRDRWDKAFGKTGSLKHLSGLLTEIRPKPDLQPNERTSSAGPRRRFLWTKLLVLDSPDGRPAVGTRDEVDSGLGTFLADRFNELEELRRRINIDPLDASDLTIESVAVDRAVLRRITFPFPYSEDEDQVAAQEDALDYLARLLNSFGGPRAFVADTLHHALFDPGSLTFQPGSLTFQPGSLTFQPGSLTFQPGSLTFQPAAVTARAVTRNPRGRLSYVPAAVLPRPTTPPSEALRGISDSRWRLSTSLSGPNRPITIAVLDTGIDEASLEQNPLLVGSATTDPEETSDFEARPGEIASGSYGHGTFIAGLIAQRAPFARINHESVRNVAGLTDAFEIAVDLNDIMGADIICLSFGIAAKDENDVAVLYEGVKYLASKGKVLIAAAGNSADLVDKNGGYDPDLQFYPAAFKEVIGVGAVDANGEPAPFSPERDWIDVWSYGVNVVSSFPVANVRWSPTSPRLHFDGWASWSGSSMAAPRVAAAIADAAARSGTSARDIGECIKKEARERAPIRFRPIIA
jgi:hypothetical protein